MSAAKILLVDDDADFTESSKDLLEAYGYEVAVAHDGTAGIELARRERPDLILLDVMMTTNTEGLDVCRKIREIPALQGVRIVMVTGVSQAMKLPRPLECDPAWLPADRILEKPVPPARLIATVKKVLAGEPPGAAAP